MCPPPGLTAGEEVTGPLASLGGGAGGTSPPTLKHKSEKIVNNAGVKNEKIVKNAGVKNADTRDCSDKDTKDYKSGCAS